MPRCLTDASVVPRSGLTTPRAPARWLPLALVACLLQLPSVAPAHAQVVADGDFAGWTFSATGTATVTRELAGGNPDARLKLTTVSGPTVWGTAIGPTAFAGVLEGGAFDFAVEFLSGPGTFGQGQRVNLLAEQGSAIYIRSLPEVYTFVRGTWTPVAFSGSLNAAGFTRLLGAGPDAPDFSGAVATRFGFAGNNTISGTLTNYYDNFSLTVTPVSAVPEPATLALLSGGLLGLGAIARRRRTA